MPVENGPHLAILNRATVAWECLPARVLDNLFPNLKIQRNINLLDGSPIPPLAGTLSIQH